ncbi:cell division protein FtsA [Anseongella ginsenosidimutans]|uniref:Cell division protein FtsA n=1 Tax=Anseongella ginsenosidimutans TaxID=496056 RepID=A0A4R3KY76_9SPHI|nr:cell division protein FtsA [Anseongella ginsenosidimutans]QEC50973.1 cell division protein FtsA [Anseongella ginsenosidimutans]TCS90381.1 cell division protein FtsA [Anseongella ginsenosidimutans]
MEKPEIVVGLDIGTTKICAIIGCRTETGKLEILGMGKAESAGVMRGVVTNIDKTVNGILEAAQVAGDKANVDIRVVNVGIAGQHIRSLQHRGILTRNNTNTEISKADIDRLIQDMQRLMMPPGEEIIHVLPQEFTVDNEPGITDPIGMAGVRLEANFHIISGQVNAISNIYKCVTKAGLKTQDLILEPLASSEAVLSAEEKEAGVVLVDIGGGTTDIAIFHNNIIRHTAVIPLGGNIVTEDIREGCMVMKNQAELLKLKFGSALADENKDSEIISIPGLRGREPKEISVRNLAYIIQARMEEIIEHVYYEIKSSGYEKKLIAGIVLTGGGAQLKHLTQLVEYVTGMDARIGYPNEHIARSTVEEIKSPMYATGIGLVIKALHAMNKERQPQQADARPQQKQQRTQGLFDKILQKGRNWLENDIEDSDYLR